MAVGTHALFQDDVAYHRLGLTVIDEQHRFGVADRRRLAEKAETAHLLAMSATPIPRTLELTLYGDLDVSRLDEKPAGRKPVATRAVPMPRLPEIIERLRVAVASGAQAFWICPLVAESEDSDLAAAEARAAILTKVFGSKVGLIHGRLAPSAKDSVMTEFVEGRLGVLVATTVVEVGVNVPNATIMVIEQAERFGLAQLHQLRGRVGRGVRESACVLLYDPPLGKTAQARIDILRRTDDGFLIAEKDLELRGGGDPLGLRQSGFPAYRLADPVAHRQTDRHGGGRRAPAASARSRTDKRTRPRRTGAQGAVRLDAGRCGRGVKRSTGPQPRRLEISLAWPRPARAPTDAGPGTSHRRRWRACRRRSACRCR